MVDPPRYHLPVRKLVRPSRTETAVGLSQRRNSVLMSALMFPNELLGLKQANKIRSTLYILRVSRVNHHKESPQQEKQGIAKFVSETQH